MTANYKIHSHGAKKVYTSPSTDVQPLTQSAFDYLNKVRGLYPETLERFGIGCATPKGKIEIAIPVFDERGKLQLVKFRHETGGKILRKEEVKNGQWQDRELKTAIEPGGKPILFGSHLCDAAAGPLVICFGDYDAMAVYQDGVPNCVSLPFGDGGFGFLEFQTEFIDTFDTIILYSDNDKHSTAEAEERAFKKLTELASRIGKHRVKLISKEDRYDTKDANELLIKKGEGFNKMLVDNADWFPVGIVDIADYAEQPIANGAPIGIPEIDRITNGFAPKQVVIVSGDSEAGKTTNVLNWVANWIEQKIPVFFWSGEQSIPELRNSFERIACGPGNLWTYTNPDTEFEIYYPLKDRVEALRNWYRGHFFQLTDCDITKEVFFESAEVALRRHGCKFIVADNLMAFTGGELENYYHAQGDFVQSCKRFADKWDVTVILICHTRKIEEQENAKRPKLPDKNSVEGSKKITNWADFHLHIYRVPDVWKMPSEYGKDFYELEGVDALTMLLKNRKSPQKRNVRMLFNAKSNRLWQMSIENGDLKKLTWEKEFER